MGLNLLEDSQISKDALVDKARALLQNAIMTGQIPQGHRINETTLARQLQISRGPIREALAGLTNQGLVVKAPNRGVFVIKLTRSDIEELYTLRSMYEVFALHYIITHGQPLPYDVLAEIIEEIGASATSPNAESETSAADLRFHLEIIKAAGLPRLLSAWRDLMPQFQMLLYSRNALSSDFRVDIVGAHQRIIDALKRGDGNGAEQFLKAHIDASYQKLLADWEE